MNLPHRFFICTSENSAVYFRKRPQQGICSSEPYFISAVPHHGGKCRGLPSRTLFLGLLRGTLIPALTACTSKRINPKRALALRFLLPGSASERQTREISNSRQSRLLETPEPGSVRTRERNSKGSYGASCQPAGEDGGRLCGDNSCGRGGASIGRALGKLGKALGLRGLWRCG